MEGERKLEEGGWGGVEDGEGWTMGRHALPRMLGRDAC